MLLVEINLIAIEAVTTDARTAGVGRHRGPHGLSRTRDGRDNALEWCPLPDSNRHAHRAQDFKSCMSTDSIKGAGALSLARIAPAAKFGIEGPQCRHCAMLNWDGA